MIKHAAASVGISLSDDVLTDIEWPAINSDGVTMGFVSRADFGGCIVRVKGSASPFFNIEPYSSVAYAIIVRLPGVLNDRLAAHSRALSGENIISGSFLPSLLIVALI